ncbi:hypothetical protein TNIN_311431 [Trichonephila inaurata madagascariensis]|uniref:Uncharacterized protein n=1 Tax=Trichonephila inaurata madagascariensis TaxID=2747483 RepID=A0A8X6XCV8_9ARAC|nr:hypothetical protein TNIN_311431 [Trichonephila inaurata madagascariensis]
MVTYGIKPAPYLATRCLLQLAHEGKNKYPLAAPVIENSPYMDGILSEADDTTTAKDMQRQLTDLISRGATKLQLLYELWWTGPSFSKDKTLNSDSVVSQRKTTTFSKNLKPLTLYIPSSPILWPISIP